MSPFEPLSEQEESIAAQLVDSAFAVHKELGPGLLEQVYEVCLCHELNKRGLTFQRQVPIPVQYDGIKFSVGFRLDLLIEDLVISELKTVERLMPVHTAQILTYLKLSNKRLGFLINFNVPILKKGIQRIIV